MIIKPYGDKTDDGMVQLSFTLPTKESAEAKQAAVEMAQKMGFEKILVAHMEAIDAEHTFFVVYGKTNAEINMDNIEVVQRDNPLLSFEDINKAIEKNLKRKIVVIGACIGSDAHTVGIDAIFNMKGYHQDWGFERYPWMDAHNLRAQVDVNDLAQKIIELKADAVLVSRVVTQRDEHIVQLKKFLEVLKQTSNVNDHLIKICGGPRISHEEALEWGYDAGFGAGTLPSEVGSFLVHELIKRIGV